MTLRVMWCKNWKFQSLKSILITYIWKSWNSYSLQVKYCNMYISQSENSKTKISKSVILHAVTLWGSKICSVSLYLLQFLRFHFQGHMSYWGSCDIKWKISKFVIFACSNPARVGNSLCFALSLTVSEISANLKILNILKFLKIMKFFESFEMFINVLLWWLTTPVIT